MTTRDREAMLTAGFEGFDIGFAPSDGARIGYRTAGTGEPIVFMHGFPQTGYEWRTVARDLSSDFKVIVVDSRGSGGSDKPDPGYDKATMAADVHSVVRHLGVDLAHVVGHDIGVMMAFAYGQLFAPEVASITMIDAIIPGTTSYDEFCATGIPWHFGFHNNIELATRLLAGREDAYLDWIFDGYTQVKEAVVGEDRAFYVDALRLPGALEANLKSYAAFADDAVFNRKLLHEQGKIVTSLLFLRGDVPPGAGPEPLPEEIAETGQVVVVPESGHYIPEEQPQAVVQELRQFLESNPITHRLPGTG